MNSKHMRIKGVHSTQHPALQSLVSQEEQTCFSYKLQLQAGQMVDTIQVARKSNSQLKEVNSVAQSELILLRQCHKTYLNSTISVC